jgi:hypothetical protein
MFSRCLPESVDNVAIAVPFLRLFALWILLLKSKAFNISVFFRNSPARD